MLILLWVFMISHIEWLRLEIHGERDNGMEELHNKTKVFGQKYLKLINKKLDILKEMMEHFLCFGMTLLTTLQWLILVSSMIMLTIFVNKHNLIDIMDKCLNLRHKVVLLQLDFLKNL